jgi:hypothetical protein
MKMQVADHVESLTERRVDLLHYPRRVLRLESSLLSRQVSQAKERAAFRPSDNDLDAYSAHY